MNANRITRRQALATGLGVGLGVSFPVTAAPVPKDDGKKTLVGRIVLPRQYITLGAVVELLDPAAPRDDVPVPIRAPLLAASYAVKGESGTLLEVLVPDGRAVRVERDSMILLGEAVEFFSTQIKDAPTNTFALNSRGWAYYLLGESAKTVTDFTEFLRQTPADGVPLPGVPMRWEGLVNRGLVYAEQGEFEKALKDLDRVTELSPDNPLGWLNRGFTFELMGDYPKAIADYDRAIQVALGDLMARNNKAWVLATCPDEKIRDATRAIELSRATCAATRNQEGTYLDTQAASSAAAGKFDDAVKAQEKALEDTSYVARYGEDGQKRLQLYQGKKPFRTKPVKK